MSEFLSVARAMDPDHGSFRYHSRPVYTVAPAVPAVRGDDLVRGRAAVGGADRDAALGQVGILDRISLQLGRDVASFLQGTALHERLARVDNDARREPTPRLAAHVDRKFRHLAEPARSYAGRSEVLDGVLDALLRIPDHRDHAERPFAITAIVA